MCFLTSAPTTLAEAAAMTSATASSSSGALADEVPINLILKAGVDRTGTEKWMLDSTHRNRGTRVDRYLRALPDNASCKSSCEIALSPSRYAPSTSVLILPMVLKRCSSARHSARKRYTWALCFLPPSPCSDISAPNSTVPVPFGLTAPVRIYDSSFSVK